MQNLARVSNEVSNDDLGTHVAAEAAAKSTTFVLWYGAIINTSVQCNLDLVTPYLVTNLDLVTILQKTIFFVLKNISFSDNLVFSATSI